MRRENPGGKVEHGLFLKIPRVKTKKLINNCQKVFRESGVLVGRCPTSIQVGGPTGKGGIRGLIYGISEGREKKKLGGDWFNNVGDGFTASS